MRRTGHERDRVERRAAPGRAALDPPGAAGATSPGSAPSAPTDGHADAWRDESQLQRRPGTARSPSREPRACGPAARHHRRTTFERIYRAFIAARAALGVALVVDPRRRRRVRPAADADDRRAQRRLRGAGDQHVAAAALSPRRRRRTRWRGCAARNGSRRSAPTWCSSPACTSPSPGSSFNYVALLVLPVLMAGVLTPRVLGARDRGASRRWRCSAPPGSALLSGGDATLLMTQAGLAGSGFFVITVLAGELAGRLAREELSARGSLELARQQAQLEPAGDRGDGGRRAGRRPRRQGARRQPGGAPAARPRGHEPRGAVPAARRARPGARWSTRSSAPSPRPPGPRPAATWRCSSLPTRTARCACASASRASASRARARSSACSSSRTCATCRRAAARRSSPPWAGSRPASRTRSATRSPRSRRPTRCSPRTPPTRRSAS